LKTGLALYPLQSAHAPANRKSKLAIPGSHHVTIRGGARRLRRLSSVSEISAKINRILLQVANLLLLFERELPYEALRFFHAANCIGSLFAKTHEIRVKKVFSLSACCECSFLNSIIL
jgi:hypothetical protein